jgi:hypothetical protein
MRVHTCRWMFAEPLQNGEHEFEISNSQFQISAYR